MQLCIFFFLISLPSSFPMLANKVGFCSFVGVFLWSYLGEMQRILITLMLPSQISIALVRGTYRHHS